MNEPIANLPVTIFKFAMSPFSEWQELAWAGVLLITLCVLLLNIIARVVFAQKNTNPRRIKELIERSNHD